jgi:hypothetical protein
MRAIASCLGFLLLCLPGCARKNPGPEECRAFALASIGAPPGTPASLLESRPELAARAEEVTRECLTKPWDYQVLGCLQSGGSSRVCLSRFEQRRASGATNIE